MHSFFAVYYMQKFIKQAIGTTMCEQWLLYFNTKSEKEALFIVARVVYEYTVMPTISDFVAISKMFHDESSYTNEFNVILNNVKSEYAKSMDLMVCAVIDCACKRLV